MGGRKLGGEFGQIWTENLLHLFLNHPGLTVIILKSCGGLQELSFSDLGFWAGCFLCPSTSTFPGSLTNGNEPDGTNGLPCPPAPSWIQLMELEGGEVRLGYLFSWIPAPVGCPWMAVPFDRRLQLLSRWHPLQDFHLLLGIMPSSLPLSPECLVTVTLVPGDCIIPCGFPAKF